MPRAPLPHLVALLCGVLAALAVGCGDRSNLIPANRADALTRQLADLKASIDQGECDGLSARVKTFHDDATNLSSSVDSRLRKRINQGVAALQDTAAKDCQAAANAQTTETTPTDTTTTETQTETTKTETQTQTETQATTETGTTTQPSSAAPPSTAEPGTTTDPGTGNGGVTPDDGTATP